MGNTLVRLVNATHNTGLRLETVHGRLLADKGTAKVVLLQPAEKRNNQFSPASSADRSTAEAVPSARPTFFSVACERQTAESLVQVDSKRTRSLPFAKV